MSVDQLLIVIPAVTAAIVSILNAWNARYQHHQLTQNTALTAQTQDTASQINATASQIKTLVNGQSEAMRKALDTAQAHILALEAELALLKGKP